MVKKLCVILLVLFPVFGVVSCGSTSETTTGSHSKEASDVKESINKMLTELERGDYKSACEDFTARSRLAMAFAPAFDGRQSSSSCSDVFIVAGMLNGLGLTSSAAHLRAVAEGTGLGRQVDLSDAQAHNVYRGLSLIDLETLGKLRAEEGVVKDGRGSIIARNENGHWQLEAVKAETTYREARAITERRCRRSIGKSYRQLCRLVAPVLAGEVLTGRKHREFDQLLPVMFSLRQSNRRIFEQAQVSG